MSESIKISSSVTAANNIIAAQNRALFAANFVIVFGQHPHVRKMYTPVRAEHDFALSIKNRLGRERPCV